MFSTLDLSRGISIVTETNEERVKIHFHNVRTQFQEALLTRSVHLVDILFRSAHNLPRKVFEPSWALAKLEKTNALFSHWFFHFNHEGSRSIHDQFRLYDIFSLQSKLSTTFSSPRRRVSHLRSRVANYFST